MAWAAVGFFFGFVVWVAVRCTLTQKNGFLAKVLCTLCLSGGFIAGLCLDVFFLWPNIGLAHFHL